MKKKLFKLIVLLSISAMAQQQSFDKNWKFIQEDILGAEQVNFNDNSWRVLDVPHDWSIEGEYDEANPMGDQCGYLPAGFGWYRKTIDVPQEWKGKYVEIAFDGVCMNSTVWANGEKLGNRPYGWVSFAYNISKQVANSNKITFAVRVDNNKQPSARWYTGSGIYAHTWINVKENLHIARDGVFVRTKGNSVFIDTKIENKTLKSSKGILKTYVLNANGNKLSATSAKFKIAESSNNKIEQTITLNSPELWSVENPTLYTLVSEVVVKGKTIDKKETKFGVRDVEWKDGTGMWINGKNIKLQGVCNHQDAGALGAAVPDKILRFRIQQLKDMGVNAIRTSHNPQTPIFYDLCDEMGMMVMDEIFDGWMQKAQNDYGAHHFNTWWKQDVTDWIKRGRNHPSIVIYSVGNETRGDIGKDLVATCHQFDNTRLVTSGHSASEYMDVFGVNGHSEKQGFFEELKHEGHPFFIGTENTHTWQVRGFYRTKTWFRDGFPSERQKPYPLPDLTEKEVFSHDWVSDLERGHKKQIFNSSYDNAMVRVSSRLNIEQLRDIPEYAGSFRWTGYDYIGEAGYVHGGWPFKSFMGGAIDMANFEKDLFYLYQSQWTSKPMVHILPHWTHPKVALGTKIPVWVYSNCDEVELFFNNKSLGTIKPGTIWNKMQCQWMVKWQPGSLKAVGYKKGKAITTKTIRTANAPSKIELSVDGKPLAKAGQDIVQIRVTTTDDKGEMYPYGENRTFFYVFGPAKIRALDNGSPIDVEKHFEAKDRNAFYGLTRAYIESNENSGDITLLASSILGEKKQITSNKVSIDTKLIALRGKLKNVNIEVFYTIDGFEPKTTSKKYEGPFNVKLGATVKAMVVANGKPVQILQERFALDEGFLWNKIKEGKTIIEGEQAENAKTIQGKTLYKGKDYRGKGYVKLAKKGDFVSWYQENDGGEVAVDMYIRHGGKNIDEVGAYINVLVNGKVVKEKVLLRNTKNWGADWYKTKVNIKLGRGANNIKIINVGEVGTLIDEIFIN
ncbi:hypothetical protein GCM10022291_26010 [Postechiella marina]|uniref:Beta-galactosidase n=1 Tax=Postechiella marina TaxID=943941 RepID=A0ABP8CDA8_9FLAO